MTRHQTGRPTLCNVSDVGPMYYWDASVGVLYLRAVDPGWYINSLFTGAGVHERDGVWLNNIQNLAQYHITAQCESSTTLHDGTALCTTTMNGDNAVTGNGRVMPTATRSVNYATNQ